MMKEVAEIEGWVWCGQCGQCVELLGGCNHMTCRYVYLDWFRVGDADDVKVWIPILLYLWLEVEDV